MRPWHMFRQRRVPASHAAAHVDGNTFTLVEQFDGTRGDAGFGLLAQLVWPPETATVTMPLARAVGCRPLYFPSFFALATPSR